MSAARIQILSLGGSEQIGWAVILSFGVHLLVIAGLAFWPGMSPGRRQIFTPVYNVSLVGAPRPAPAPAPPAAAKPKPAPAPAPKPVPAAVPKPSPKPKEAIAVKPTPKTKRIARKKPAAKAPDTSKLLDSKIARLKDKVKQDRKLDSAINRLETKVASRGNKNPGAFASAQRAANQLSLRFQIYYTQLWEKVRRHWVLPEALVKSPRGLTAVVVMRIRRDGSLEKVWLEQGSGNSRFDASAIRAAERAAPYPQLPSGLRDKVHEVGIRFRPEDKG